MKASVGLGFAVTLAGWLLCGPSVAAFPQTPVALVDRAPTLPKGEAMVGFGAGTWLRAQEGGLPVGSLDLRYGATDRLEIRMLLPGLAFSALPEGAKWPGLFLYGGLCGLGFNTSEGSSVSYQVGLGLTKRVHPRLRLRLQAEFRHRFKGGETEEIAVPGPLPSARAMLAFAEMVAQLHGAIAWTGGLGFSAALGEGRSYGFGSVGFLGTVGRRTDLYAQIYLERSRGDRPFDPAFFGGIAIRF